MNSRFRNSAVEMGVDGARGQIGLTDSLAVTLSGLYWVGAGTWGSAPPPSTLGYIPAAASRLRVFATLSDQVPDIEKRIRIVK